MATYTLSPFFVHRVVAKRLQAEVSALLPSVYRVVKHGFGYSIAVCDTHSTSSLDSILTLSIGYPYEGEKYTFSHNGDRFVVEGFGFAKDGLPEQELQALLAVLCMMCTLQHTIENPKTAAPAQAAAPTQSFLDRALAVFGLKRI